LYTLIVVNFGEQTSTGTDRAVHRLTWTQCNIFICGVTFHVHPLFCLCELMDSFSVHLEAACIDVDGCRVALQHLYLGSRRNLGGSPARFGAAGSFCNTDVLYSTLLEVLIGTKGFSSMIFAGWLLRVEMIRPYCL